MLVHRSRCLNRFGANACGHFVAEVASWFRRFGDDAGLPASELYRPVGRGRVQVSNRVVGSSGITDRNVLTSHQAVTAQERVRGAADGILDVAGDQQPVASGSLTASLLSPLRQTHRYAEPILASRHGSRAQRSNYFTGPVRRSKNQTPPASPIFENSPRWVLAELQ